jgi:hypothetical protein
MVNICYFVATLKKNSDNSFSVFPKVGSNNKRLNSIENGIYISFYNKEIFAVYDKNVSKITLKQGSKKEKITEYDILQQIEKYRIITGSEKKSWLNEKKKKFYTAALCCFHPNYVEMDNEINNLEILLEGNHELIPEGFIVNTKSSVKFAPKKIGALDAYI